MVNGHPPLGLEDGTIDVERLLVEPKDEHLSMDSVICFNEKIQKNAMSIEDVSCSAGGSDTGIAQEGKGILNGEVLNAMPSEVENGYFQLENNLCSMGEEYLLGVEFAESITNLDYGSSEDMHTSGSDSQVQVSTAGSDTGCRSDLFRTDTLRECRIDSGVRGSKLSDIPHRRECETLSGENPTISPRSCTLQTSVKSQNSSSSSCQDGLSDENDGGFSQASEMFCSLKTERKHDIESTVQNGATRLIKVVTLTTSVRVSGTDVLPTEKRSRKPTKRYICEVVDPILTRPKRRREISSSTVQNKSLGVKDHKKHQIMEAKAISESPEEFSVVAIQVPFGSLASKEHSENHERDMVCVDYRNSVIKSKGKCGALQNQNKMEKCVRLGDLKKRGDRRMGQRKTNGCVAETQAKRKDGLATTTIQKKRNDCGIAMIQKKRVDWFAMEEDCSSVAYQKIKDDSLMSESIEENSGRRKHHKLWTISEVNKLVDGVSQYGVGRWSRIKKLYFSASAHRTSVDLKDKWRNLLKASGVQEEGSHQGEKKRNLAWRPLPKSILNRVCELAAMHPYPKGQRAKIARMSRDSPDRSADITLSDYKRIVRRINGN